MVTAPGTIDIQSFEDATIDNYEFDGSNNTPPSVGTISASVNPVQVNTSTTTSATFTDPDTQDTHTATWNWGDGTPTNPDITTGTVTETNGSGSVSGSHTFTAAGVYPITLTVTDNHGASGSSTFQYLSVYNPTPQGLFSAGQKYTSPLGAYPQNASLTGEVHFGLSYKYQGSVRRATGSLAWTSTLLTSTSTQQPLVLW
jgi:hypothetical protein